jgi:hypothetical protein
MAFGRAGLFVLLTLVTGPARAGQGTTGLPPQIGDMPWDQNGAVCAARLEAAPADAGLVWITFPSAEKPFGMKGFVKIDGILHALRQIAYAGDGNGFSIHYRTFGDRNYDVRLEMSGPPDDGAELTGKLIASRFGQFSEVSVTGACGKGGG